MKVGAQFVKVDLLKVISFFPKKRSDFHLAPSSKKVPKDNDLALFLKLIQSEKVSGIKPPL